MQTGTQAVLAVDRILTITPVERRGELAQYFETGSDPIGAAGGWLIRPYQQCGQWMGHSWAGYGQFFETTAEETNDLIARLQ